MAKLYHPDKARSQIEKEIFGRLMVFINEAAEQDDLSTLKAIKVLGPAFLAMRENPQFHTFPNASVSPAAAEPMRHETSSGFVANIWFLLGWAEPYALLAIIQNWDAFGRGRKFVAILSSMGWTFVFQKLWYLLDAASSLCARSGYPHDSWVGLVIVLLRGAVIIAALPCIFSLGVIGFIAAIIIGFCFVLNMVASGILGLFHPYLAYVPSIILGPFLLFALWKIMVSAVGLKCTTSGRIKVHHLGRSGFLNGMGWF